MVTIKGREKILLHLIETKYSIHSKEMPLKLCQQGISEWTDLSIPRVSIYLNEYIDRNLITAKTRYIQGLKQKRKVYFLTPLGQEKAKEIKKNIIDEGVTIRSMDGEQKISLGDVDKYIDSANPLLIALNLIDEDEVIDLTFSDAEEDVFVGRQKEMDRFKEILEKVVEGETKVVLIAGEAGVGKTRLATEFEKNICDKGYQFLSGRAYYGTSEPYLPIREALEDHVDDKSPEYKPLLLMGTKGAPVVTERQKLNGQRKYIWYDLGKMLEKKASDKPLVIFLDDLQWADRSTILVINYLANKISGSPILFIGTYRPEDIDGSHPVNELISHLTRENLLEKIDLEPLEKKHVRKITQRLIGRIDIPDYFIDILYEITDGNPLFARECVKHMLEEGDIDVKSDRYPTEKDEVNIPDIVEGVIDRRIRNLEDLDTNKLLQLGAVIGDTVPFELLNHCVDMDVLDILDNVEKLMKYGLWYELPEEYTFSFSHGLIQKSVYESIPNNLRKSLHLHVAEKIERVYKDENHRYWSNLGFHYERGEKFEEAVDCYVSAGDEAKNMYAHEDAVDMYEKALRLMEGIESKADEKASVIEQIGDTYKVLGEYEKSLTYYDSLLKIKEPDKSPSIYRKIAYIMIERGNFEESIFYVEKGLGVVEPDSEEMCRLLLIKGLNLIMEGDLKEAFEIFNDEIDVAKELENKQILANGYHDLALVYSQQGNYEMSKECLKKAIELREEEGDKEGLSLSYNNLAGTYLNQRKFDNALSYYHKSLELAEELGMNYHLGKPTMNIGIIKLETGDIEEAEKYFERAEGLFEIGDQKIDMCLVYFNLAKIHLKKANLQEAYELIQEAFSIADETNYKRGKYLSFQLKGKIFRIRGELEGSIRSYDEAIEICEETNFKYELADTIMDSGKVFEDIGDIDSAIKRYIKAKNISEVIEGEIRIARADTYLAGAYVSKGDIKKSRTHLDSVSELYKEINSSELKAEYHRVKGILFREESEYESALEELEQSKELYEKLSDSPMLMEIESEIGVTMVRMGDEKDGLKIIRKVKEKATDIGMEHLKERCDKYLE